MRKSKKLELIEVDLKSIISLITLVITFGTIVFYGGGLVQDVKILKEILVGSRIVERVSALEEKYKYCGTCSGGKPAITYDN